MQQNYPLNFQQKQQLKKFVELLLEWNRKINLISRKDITNIEEKHIRESLWFCHKVIIEDAENILDLGSGGGFPGIPMKIALPSVKMTLVESKSKKAMFLRTAVEQLGLKNTKVICERAENLNSCHERYDLIVCRAVAKLDKLWSWSAPLLKSQGRLAALKGGNFADEMMRFYHKNIDSVIKIIDIKNTIDVSAEITKKMVLIYKNKKGERLG